jgi:hypothetical protein
MINAEENNKKINNRFIRINRFNRSNRFTVIRIGEI